MTTTHEITLAEVKKNDLPNAGQYFRASDFLSDTEKQQLRESNAKGKTPQKLYDKVDAYEAELLARFGWSAYKAWLTGELDEALAAKMVAAERDREKRLLEPILAMIYGANAGANNPADKNGHAPKSLRIAHEILTKYINH